LGYVGMAVPFSFAIAAMLEGKLDAIWARWVRPWTTVAWIFLTVGIALGSWWAYYTLGWGGWWFWDSVENSSFMPWLAATALIHSLAVTEKRGLFKSWTLLLAILAFSLSLLGTFLVRSGVLISVHSFASDPRRGAYILGLLAFSIVGALLLYAWRAPRFRSDVGFAMISRESFLMMNNVLLVTATAVVFLGTLSPLFVDWLRLPQISVGPPYFNAMFLVPMLPLVFLMGVGMHAGWKRADLTKMRKPLTVMLGVALLLGAFVPWLIYDRTSILTAVGVFAGLWVVASSLWDPISRLRAGHKLSLSVLGMSVAHLGIALFVLGVTVVKSYEIERDLSLSPGKSVQLGDYDFHMNSVQKVAGPNYSAVESEIVITKAGNEVATLHPQKRLYQVQRSELTHAGIDPSLRRDLFVAMGQAIGKEAWSMRIHYYPMLRFVWLGALVMAFGGLLAVSDRRYRTVTERAVAPIPAAAGPA
jgi:cytochrome c-type biogenesis protein CcmF